MIQRRKINIDSKYAKMRFFSKNWLLSLWNGERPLWEAWWVFGLFTFLIILTFRVAISLLLPLPLLYYASWAFLGLVITLQFFWWVAIWRCSPNVHNNVWNYIARIIVFMACLTTLSNLIRGM